MQFNFAHQEKRQRALAALVLGLCLGIGGREAAGAGEDWARGLREIQGFFQAGLAAYKAGKIDEAEGNFSDAYFVAFEASGLETAIRQKISGRRAFQLERLFHNLRKMALAKVEVKALEAEMARTLQEVSQEVARLRAQPKALR